ncbi:unnamed protein product [Paramecium pentaurelia]|uniref:Uncharacterized protein n=1 Tax=Paramecium pentaurelia TaxID=43138 RepID=A0A8S1W4S0_9CILI|nr:unnamed protein product [Paramecium pentaurelia]
MKSQNSKKPNLKLTLNKKSMGQLIQCDKPPSSKCSQKTTSSNGKTSNSSKQLCFKFQDNQSTANPSLISEGDKKLLEPDQSQLIQLLIQENLQLQKQNSDKDSIISRLITNTNKKPVILQRANTSNTERTPEKLFTIKKLQQNTCEKKSNSPLGFTFCNVDKEDEGKVIQSQPMTRSQKRLPKEFQIVPNQRRFFI